MHIFFWLIVGLMAGMLAKSVVRGEGPGGWIGDIVIGLVGSIVGGFLFETFAHHSYGGWIGSTFVAFCGAVALLLLMRFLHRRR